MGALLDHVPILLLAGTLLLLFVLSAFFSGSETAFMSVNRYYLANLAAQGNRIARLTIDLLKKPDRLIGTILLGNNLVNILIAQLATYLGYRIYGDIGIAVATGALTFLLLVFAELAPKTFAVAHPRRLSLIAAPIILLLSVIAAPLVRLISWISNNLIRSFGASAKSGADRPLTLDELRMALLASQQYIAPEYQEMLANIIDLEKIKARDVMVPVGEVVGINLDDHPEDIRNSLIDSVYTRLPLYRGSLNNVVGTLHVRHTLRLLNDRALAGETLEALVNKPYYVHEDTNLLQTLLDLKRHKRRISLVVDEYGDLQGLLTLEDLLEEIVGEFTRDPASYDHEIQHDANGSIIVNGNCRIDEINEELNWQLDKKGAGTINGLILEHLESIPEPGTGLLINDHPVEILKADRYAVRKVKIKPVLEQERTAQP